MTPEDETERRLIEVTVTLDALQEDAPLDISGYLEDIQKDLHRVLRLYRENREAAEE